MHNDRSELKKHLGIKEKGCDLELRMPLYVCSDNKRLTVTEKTQSLYPVRLVNEKLHEKAYSLIELIILKCLSKYEYMNIRNLNRYLSRSGMLPQGYSKDSYRNNVNRLYQDGLLKKYTYSNKYIETQGKLVFYALSDAGYTYIKRADKLIKRNNMDDIGSILPILSLNQYHTGILCQNCTKTVYEAYKRSDDHCGINIMVDSEILLDTSITSMEGIMLLGLVKRDGINLKEKVLLYNKYALQKEYGAYAIVIICRDINDEIMCAKEIEKEKELEEIPVYYTNDLNTHKDRMNEYIDIFEDGRLIGLTLI